jgi:phosphatidylinositol-3-phosphatase
MGTQRGVTVLAGLAITSLVALLAAPGPASAATPLTMCGNTGPAPTPVKHVLVVVLENQSYDQVMGHAKLRASTMLASSCGVGSKTFGASHTSASNYLALVSGTVGHFSGCGSVSACSSPGQVNLFSQLRTAGLTWKSYEEAMPGACWQHSTSGTYKIGHNPALFYGLPDCAKNDVPVPDLTASSGPFYADLTQRTLPAYAFVTPSLVNDGEGKGGYPAADAWLAKFVAVVEGSPSYQSGDTLLLVTNDEGTGTDAVKGEDCTARTRDLAGTQESCHVPLFVVYPWAGGKDGTFFDHYSLLRTVEDLFGLTPLAGAAGVTSLVGHFGIPARN